MQVGHALVVSRTAVLRGLLAAVLLLALMDASALAWRLGFDGKGLDRLLQLIHLDGEGNLPSFFSSMLLLGAALLCFVAGRVKSADGSPVRWYWYILACALAFLAVDEAAQLHEVLNGLISRAWSNRGALRWPWVVPYAAAAFVLAVICLPFLRALPRPVSARMVVAGAIFVLGAAGLDMIEGAILHFMRAGDRSLEPFFLGLPILEESLEMTGVILFIDAVLRYLALRDADINVRIVDSALASQASTDGRRSLPEPRSEHVRSPQPM